MKGIICIDETSLNAYEVRKHCYNKLGKRCVIKTKSQKVFKKYTTLYQIIRTIKLLWKKQYLQIQNLQNLGGNNKKKY